MTNGIREQASGEHYSCHPYVRVRSFVTCVSYKIEKITFQCFYKYLFNMTEKQTIDTEVLDKSTYE